MADYFVKFDPKDVFSEGNDIIGDLCRSIVAETDKRASDEIAEVIQKHYPGVICDGAKVLELTRRLKTQEMPDMVEVVRCKDCKHWRKTKTDPIILRDYGECCCKNFWDIHLTTSKDFCSYGERK